MKKILVIMVSVAVLGLLFAGCANFSNITTPGSAVEQGVVTLSREVTTDPDFSGQAQIQTLYAGQNIDVGTVKVWNDEEVLCVEYELSKKALDEGWLIYETHLAIENELSKIPTNKPGNPIPGHFQYGENFEEGVDYWKQCIKLEDASFVKGGDLFIAAHAVIERTECETLAEAPYGGSSVVNTFQAWRIDHTPEAPRYVKEQRSNSYNALEIGIPGQETFYSLGYGGVLNEDGTAVETFFGEYFEDRRDPDDIRVMEDLVKEVLAAELSDTANNAGWIIIEFDPAVLNVEGEYDLQVVEDTWGLPYPLELAAVFGRADASDDWTFLFLAHNQEPVGSPTYHTYTNGTLGDLDQAVQILVQDVSDPQWFIPYPHSVVTLDGYDLNAVVALNNHEVCEEFDETAWAEGKRFVPRGNWATYFSYTVKGWVEKNSLSVTSEIANKWECSESLLDGELYRFEASGTFTYNQAGDWADAEWYLKDGEIVKGDTEGSKPYVLDVSIDEYSINRNWGDYNSDHIYYIYWNGTSSPACFSIYDSVHGDNKGSIEVTIYVWE